MIGLKSQNILNLKGFLSSLESETLSKQNELKQVVGSKYHDFIQSGQYIDSIHSDSKKIEKAVGNFSDLNKSLIDNSIKIISQSTENTDENINLAIFQGL